MSLAMAASTTVMDVVHTSSYWKSFLIDIVLKSRNRYMCLLYACLFSFVRLIRVSAQDQLFNMITKCCTDSAVVLVSSIKLLFQALEVCFYAFVMF